MQPLQNAHAGVADRGAYEEVQILEGDVDSLTMDRSADGGYVRVNGVHIVWYVVGGDGIGSGTV